LRPLLAKKHQSGYRTAIHFQSDSSNFSPCLSAIGKLRGLLTKVGKSLTLREFRRGGDAEEGSGFDKKADFALELSLALMAQPSLDVKDL